MTTDNVAVKDTANTDAGRVIHGDAVNGIADVHTPLTVTEVNGLATEVGKPIVGQFGTLVLNADGNYSYTENSAVDALQVGQSGTDAFIFTATDSVGGITTTSLSFNVTGADDTPIITSAPESGSVVEGFTSTLLGNQVTNGGFENGLSGWTVAFGGTGDFDGPTSDVHSGNVAFDFETPSLSSSDILKLSQSVANTVAGVSYTLSFWVANEASTTPSSLSVLWNGASVLALSNIPGTGGDTDFTEYTVNVTGTGAPSTLEFDIADRRSQCLHPR